MSKETLIALEGVLCDPEGRVCIQGSDEDRRIIQNALKELRSQAAALPDADQSAVPIFRGFAVVNSQGYFEGIWREYATAELWVNKQRDKGRIVEMEAIRARHK